MKLSCDGVVYAVLWKAQLTLRDPGVISGRSACDVMPRLHHKPSATHATSRGKLNQFFVASCITQHRVLIMRLTHLQYQSHGVLVTVIRIPSAAAENMRR